MPKIISLIVTDLAIPFAKNNLPRVVSNIASNMQLRMQYINLKEEVEKEL